MENSKFTAVLFDLDGTIVEIDWDLELEEKLVAGFATRHGIDLEKEKLDWLSFGRIRKLLKKESQKKDFVRRLFEFESMMIDKRKVELCPGAKEIVRLVKLNGMKTAIVSNNFHENVVRVLEHFGLREYFDAIVCWDDVWEPKPSPEGIIEALRRLKTKPDEALFVGDGRYTDLAAAHAASVETVIFPRGKIAENKEKIFERI